MQQRPILKYLGTAAAAVLLAGGLSIAASAQDKAKGNQFNDNPDSGGASAVAGGDIELITGST